jgi:hypothetical protein
MSCHQNAKQNKNLQIANKSFENVARFKYLRPGLTNQNCFHKEIKSGSNLGDACHHSAQKLSSSQLLSKNLKI